MADLRSAYRRIMDEHFPDRMEISFVDDTGRQQALVFRVEKGDIRTAVESYGHIPWGKEGFHEWWPPVAFEHENEDYVWALFEALAERWHRLMGLLCKGQTV